MRLALTALACVALLSGCGSSGPKSSTISQTTVKRALSGSAPKLAALHNQGGKLIGGAKTDFDARMAELRGYPIVVNKWAAWCGPCRLEFPVFQKVALQVGKQVAFLGLDAQDNDGNARAFLKKFPVSYPSYRDPDLKIANSIQAGVAFPTTIFFDKRGKLVYAHPGPYDNAKDLVTDIRRYAE